MWGMLVTSKLESMNEDSPVWIMDGQKPIQPSSYNVYVSPIFVVQPPDAQPYLRVTMCRHHLKNAVVR